MHRKIGSERPSIDARPGLSPSAASLELVNPSTYTDDGNDITVGDGMMSVVDRTTRFISISR